MCWVYPCEERKEWYEFLHTSLQYDHCTYIHTRLTTSYIVFIQFIVLLWNLLDSAGGGIAFWSVGYAFAYGGDSVSDGNATFVGNRGFFMQNDTIRFENWFFQFAFACAVSCTSCSRIFITVPSVTTLSHGSEIYNVACVFPCSTIYLFTIAIVAGTIAERLQMRAYLFYSFFIVGFAYPVAAHAYWSTHGFMSAFKLDPLWGTGVIDFAGSGPVHMLGGVSALVAAIILGPRIGRFYDRDGNLLAEPYDFPPHSVALQVRNISLHFC